MPPQIHRSFYRPPSKNNINIWSNARWSMATKSARMYYSQHRMQIDFDLFINNFNDTDANLVFPLAPKTKRSPKRWTICACCLASRYWTLFQVVCRPKSMLVCRLTRKPVLTRQSNWSVSTKNWASIAIVCWSNWRPPGKAFRLPSKFDERTQVNHSIYFILFSFAEFSKQNTTFIAIWHCCFHSRKPSHVLRPVSHWFHHLLDAFWIGTCQIRIKNNTRPPKIRELCRSHKSTTITRNTTTKQLLWVHRSVTPVK